MANPQYYSKVVTVDADGDAVVYTEALWGRLVSIDYIKDDFADGVDFLIETNETGKVLWDQDDVNADATVAPRQPTHANDGTASLYAGGGEPVEDYYRLCNEAVKITIASGGNATSGTFRFIYE